MKFILTCPFGTTQIAKKELSILGYKATITSHTSVEFEWDEATIARVNINSRIGNKLFLVLATGQAKDFESLFGVISSVDRSVYIAPQQPVLTDALTRQSQLTSVPTIQWITKKAITKKLTGSDERRDEDNTLQAIDIMITLDHNTCYVLLNTTWESLHERGYRHHTGIAPLKENLAAAFVLSSGRKFSTPLVDPFCGAWTMCIEAALIAKNIAPWMNRWFAFHGFSWYPSSHFKDAMTVAEAKIMTDKKHTIIGHDIDPMMIDMARRNARNAGVEDYIEFSVRDFMTTSVMPDFNVISTDVIGGDTSVIASTAKQSIESQDNRFSIVTNPPYGERMNIAESMMLYRRLLDLYENNENINGGFISNAPDVETLFNYRLWKHSKFYNGPLECSFYKIARL
jgi:putative N6-adenine-specific DNA methylase